MSSDPLQHSGEGSLWHTIVESTAAPICAFDTEFRLIAFNKAHSDEFFRIFAYRVQLGDNFPDLFPPEQGVIIKGFMSRALAGETFNVTEEFGDPALNKPYWDIAYTPLRNSEGTVIGAFHYAQDISDRLRAEAALRDAEKALEVQQTNARFALALTGSPVVVYEQDENLVYRWAANEPASVKARYGSIVGLTDADIGLDPMVTGLKRHVLQTGEDLDQVISFEGAGEQEWYRILVKSVRLKNGRQGIVGAATDISALKRHEQHLQTVLREMTHRSKNLLAVVQAISLQTARFQKDPTAFNRDFGSRLRALAQSHDMIAKQGWQGAKVEEMVHGQLGHIVQSYPGRITLEGSDHLLAPEAAQYLGLAVHELATNATKYGALSTDGGVVDVGWSEKSGGFEFEWRESGGPTPAGDRKGFGRLLLEDIVPRAVQGLAAFEFASGGIRWRLTIP